MKKTICLLLVGITCLVSNPAIATYEQAIKEIKNKNYSKAIKLFKKSASKEIGDPRSQSALGGIYFEGAFGQKKNMKLALKYWRLATRQRFPEAMRNLGLMYAQGNGVKINIEKAEKLLKAAAKKGDVVALLNIGLIYLNSGDAQRASSYITIAAKKGHPKALEILKQNGINDLPPLPGESMASAILVKDTLKGVISAAQNAIGEKCKPTEYKITDSKIIKDIHSIKIKDKEYTSISEAWLVELCNKKISVLIDFVISKSEIGTTYIIRKTKILN